MKDKLTNVLELFPSGVCSYEEAKKRLAKHLSEEKQPFVLIGLSLGATLALELSSYDLPNLQALVLSGCPLKLAGNILFKIQLMIFKLLPESFFEKQGADKTLMVGVSEELKTLDLTQIAQNCHYPSLLICGSKDLPNLISMRKLYQLLPQAQFQIIADGSHTLNTDKSKEFAEKTKSFLETPK